MGDGLQGSAAIETRDEPQAIEPKPLAGKAQQTAGVDPNYQYWRDHGGTWIDGYDQRKKRQVLYHIQELMLTQYILQHSLTAATRPMKVLEFGCGVGRHLSNLTRLPDVDAYGYDQSLAMVQGVRRWAGNEWFDSHITVGMPTGALPYPDKHFDIVYSAEVLVHVRPEHIDGILRELVRVCRGHILHMETSEHIKLYSGAHEGCWRHDLVAAYARLGLSCEVLPSGYSAHTPYRVKLGEEPRFTWAPAMLEMYRRLEHDIDEGFAQVDRAAAEQAVAAAAQNAEAQEALVKQHGQQIEAIQRQLAAITADAEGHAARAAALADELAKTKAALDEAIAANRATSEQLRKKCEALANAGAALQAKLAELGAEKATAAALLSQRQAFVMAVSKHLHD
jgi:SAM-dependent methyltransferase